MKASEVFTPGKFPRHTFVDDHLRDKRAQLLDTLEAGAMLISIAGPSKSGKTVFIEECLGRTNLIPVTGAGVTAPSDLWMRVFDIIGTELPTSVSRAVGGSGTVGGKGFLEGNVFLVKGRTEGSVSHTHSDNETVTSSLSADCLQLLIRELKDTQLVVFIDDFHYVPVDVQVELARQIKEAIRNGVRIVCASVPYHADDVLRSNPDLRGRVFSIDFEYWASDVLRKIALKGFAELDIAYDNEAISKLVAEAAGSPQLMQYLCLNTCYELGVREKSTRAATLTADSSLHEAICRRTVQSTDYGSVLELMKEGPKTRGSDRNVYATRFGWNGDVYRLLVKALSIDPPQLTFRYNSLNERVSSLCPAGGPSGSSITSACAHAAKIVNDAAGSRIVEWDGTHDVFDVRDPYFLFYLRWSEAVDS